MWELVRGVGRLDGEGIRGRLYMREHARMGEVVAMYISKQK